jgi:hypothetical protein
VIRLHIEAAVSNGKTYSDMYDPEKVYFYTDTDPSLNTNTDSWPKQIGVDYGYVTREALQKSDPTAIANHTQGDVHNFKTEEEPWTQRLLGPFTYHLQPPSFAANITAGVSSTPIGAALRSVTIRGQSFAARSERSLSA